MRPATLTDWKRLQQALWLWNPLGLLPSRNEYDCLITPVLRALERGANHVTVADVLNRHLEGNFGVATDRTELKQFAVDVVEWFGQ